MKFFKDWLKLLLQRLSFLPWLVLGVSLIFTFILRQIVLTNAYEAKEENFISQAREVENLIDQRLKTYRVILHSTLGLYAASEKVERKEFEIFINNLNLQENYPGIQAIGYSQIIYPAEKNRHIEAIRKEGFLDYKIYPGGKRNLYTSIIYIEPFADRNLRAFGYDMYSDPARRSAMEQARDLNQVAISGKVKLVQETQKNWQSGFLMYLPVYKSKQPPATIAERRSAITGWVYCAFRMNDLMAGILGDHKYDIAFKIFDGKEPAPLNLMYQSDSESYVESLAPRYQIRQSTSIFNHPWAFQLYSTPAFETALDDHEAKDITIAGAILSVLLSLLIWQLLNVRRRALTLAGQMTQDLKISEMKARSALAEVQNQKYALDQHAIVARTDVRGTITYVNKKFCEISGYSEQELIGQNHRILNSGLHSKDFFEKMYRTIASGQVWLGEICNKAQNGSNYWVLTTIVPFLNEQGKPVEYIAIRSDITKRKLAEQLLAEVNRTLQNILDAASEIAIVATNTKGTITLFNKGAEKMLGYKAAEVRGKMTPVNFHIAEEIEHYTKDIQHEFNCSLTGFEILTKKADIHGQDSHVWTYVRKDGFLLKGSLLFTPIRNEKNEVEGYLGIIRDITQEYLTQNALQRSEAKLRGLFQLSPLGIALTDMNGNFVEFNKAFSQLTGYTDDELNNLDYWKLTPREYYDQEQKQLKNLNEIGRYGPYEKEYRRKDGSLIPVRLNGVLVRDMENKTYIWSIIEDISVSKEIEVNLRRAKDAADEGNRVKSEFVAMASHELRTPLTVIQGSLNLLLGGVTGEFPEAATKLLQIANNNCKRLVRLVSDMLDLEKLESGKRELDIKSIDIIPLIEHVIESNRIIAEQANITFVFNHEQSQLIALIDDDAFIQALTNLIGNAIKFSFPGGKIEIDARTDGRKQKISVTDYGIGIQDSFRDRVFEKFSQENSSNARQKGGTGLGLSITKMLIEAMGGTISYESEPGKKTVFFFELPSSVN